jgi:hypothetical protein
MNEYIYPEQDTLRELRVKYDSYSNRDLLLILLSKIKELQMSSTAASVTIQNAVDEITADAAAQSTVVASLQTFIAGIPAVIAAAVAAAQAAGATPAQLAAFDTASAALTANTAAITAAIATPAVVGTVPAAPTA